MTDITTDRYLHEDTSRFTPLYVTKMFLYILHQTHKNIIIPEVLLELVPDFEENLRHDLKEIDSIANSGNSTKIIKYMTRDGCIVNKICAGARYEKLFDILFGLRNSKCICNDLDSFMNCVTYSVIINGDIVRELIPVSPSILFGECNMGDALCSIFKYILYLKTKDMSCFKKNEIIFKSVKFFGTPEIKSDIFFSY